MFKRLLGQAALKQEEVEEILEAARDHAGTDYERKLAETLREKAADAVNDYPIPVIIRRKQANSGEAD